MTVLVATLITDTVLLPLFVICTVSCPSAQDSDARAGELDAGAKELGANANVLAPRFTDIELND
jgi:hypothetical protein